MHLVRRSDFGQKERFYHMRQEQIDLMFHETCNLFLPRDKISPGPYSTFYIYEPSKLDLVKAWKQSCKDAYAQCILCTAYLVLPTICTRHHT